MQRLLLVGNRAWEPLQKRLSEARYTATVTAMEELPLLLAFEAQQPDAILLEMGTDTLALQVLRRVLREELKTRPIPIIGLAQHAHLSPAQFVVAVDDFVLPPHSPEEILARLTMVFWRLRRMDTQGCVQIGEITIDMRKQEVLCAGEALNLTAREYQLFVFLSTHQGRAFSREAILAQVWGYEFEGDPRVVDVTLKRVRSKLPSSSQRLIVTVRGVGYRVEG